MSHSSTVIRFALAAALALALASALPAAAQTASGFPVASPAPDLTTFCLAPVQPIPSGVTAEPGDSFNTEADYRWVHSSTHLQGKRSADKWAWGFFRPTAGSPAPLFSNFRTVVLVNNPHPVNFITVNIEYRNLAGTLIQTNTATIAPEGSYDELATPLGPSTGNNGLGSIRVVSPQGDLFTAATLHHSYRFDGVLDDEVLAPNDARRPGLASMQQFQDPGNGAATLNGGPYPTTSDGTATHVALAGNLPTFQIINPNNAATTVDLFFFRAIAGTLIGPITVTIPAQGSYIDMNLLNFFYNPATNAYTAGFNEDWLVQAISREGLPLLGEQLALDFYNGALNPFTRFRMASSMMSTKLGAVVHNPELTYTTTGPPVHSISLIGNYSSQDIGPVVIEYRDARTGTFATDVINPFPSGRSLRIAPGEPGINNYPTPVWDGNIRIRACKPGLVGWTMREVEPNPVGGLLQFRKLYGESLDGTNKNEPGNSFAVNTLGLNLRRKVAPLDRCALPTDFPAWWPSYTTFANMGNTGNVGSYFYRFFQWGTGTDVTDYALQPPPGGFAGVRWGANSFTYEDGPTNRTCRPFSFPRESSGRVDHTNGNIVGIDVIGDPLAEWNLNLPDPPVYTGPGDVVPHEPIGGVTPGELDP